MEPSGAENSTNNVSMGNTSNYSRVILDKMINVIGFFALTEDEMDQAGINKGYSTLHPHNSPEMQSDSPNTQDNQQIV